MLPNLRSTCFIATSHVSRKAEIAKSREGRKWQRKTIIQTCRAQTTGLWISLNYLSTIQNFALCSAFVIDFCVRVVTFFEEPFVMQ